MNVFQFVPLAAMLSFATGVFIPFLSALLTKRPGPVTGALTLLLASVSGFLSEWAAKGDHFAWKSALGIALVTWLTALMSHVGIVKGKLARDLHARGVK